MVQMRTLYGSSFVPIFLIVYLKIPLLLNLKEQDQFQLENLLIGEG